MEQERSDSAAEENELDVHRANERKDEEQHYVPLHAHQRVRLEDGRWVRLLAPVLATLDPRGHT